MRFGLDASVAVAASLPEPYSVQAQKLLADYDNGVHDLIILDILPLELAAALTRAERQGVLKVGEAQQRFYHFMGMQPVLYPHMRILGRAIALSSSKRVKVYDACYLEACKREGCDLVTVD